MDVGRASTSPSGSRGSARNPEDHRALFKRGHEELGYLETPHAGWRDDVGLFMGPRLTGYSGLKVADLTAVEIESRRRMTAHLEFFRRHAPGFEDAWLMLSAPQLGVRHTRRLVGAHKMAMEEWREAVRHDDEIGVSPSPSAKFANISVPYGCIVPAELDNVLVGGRHVATDPQTQAFMREIPQCWLTGQAAGVAAALSAGSGTAPRALDVRRAPARAARPGRVPAELRGPGPRHDLRHRLGVHRDHRSLLRRCLPRRLHPRGRRRCSSSTPASASTARCASRRARCRPSRRPRASPPDDRPFIAINAAWPDGAEAVDQLVAEFQAAG